MPRAGAADTPRGKEGLTEGTGTPLGDAAALLSPSPSTVEGVLAAAASARGPFHTQECVELCPASRRNWN